MRISKLFGKTQREIPAEAETASHRLMLRAGMICQVAAGVYAYLPLAWRALRKIEEIIRDEMNTADGQELMMPVLQPLEIWQLTGRDQAFGKSLFTLNDRRDRKLCLGPTHEEIVTKLVSQYVKSYRDLPIRLYQIQTKFRDEPRPRGGLLRVREFTMKDMYSFDTDEEGLDESYQTMLQAYRNIYQRCGLPTLLVEADSGAIGGKDSHEFMAITETGEDEVIHCTACDYSANMEKAQSIKRRVNDDAPEPLVEVATPGAASIEEVCRFLNIEAQQTLKAVFYIADGEFTFVVIRGDLEVNEIKLKNALKCTDLRLATETEVTTAGIIAGAASPVGLNGIKTVADDSVTSGTNFTAGANKAETHLRNVNYPRDFNAEIVTDIAKARAGEPCPRCQGKLQVTRGIEVGHIFKLGTFLSQKLGAQFTDDDGNAQPIIMGCYGIGIGRLLAAAIEQNHDDNGIIWPHPIAPYQVHLCALFPDNPKVTAAAEKIYKDLTEKGWEVLYDDREESPGVKFKDADLLGLPVRITVSPRTLEKGVAEVKRRTEPKPALVNLDEVAARLGEIIPPASR